MPPRPSAGTGKDTPELTDLVKGFRERRPEMPDLWYPAVLIKVTGAHVGFYWFPTSVVRNACSF